MEIAIAVQTKTFFLAVGLGLCLGLLYDVCRCIRIAWRMKKLATAILDILYCFCTLCALFIFVLTVCQGAMRGYIWIGVGIGLLLYFNGFSHLIMGIMRPAIKLARSFVASITDVCRKIVHFMLRNFDFPRGN